MSVLFKNERKKYDIGEIYARQVDCVYRVCLSYAKTKADTEDCVSDTFMKLIKAQPEFESIEHEKAWLIRVAANTCKDFLKKSAPLDYEELEPTLAAPDNSQNREVMEAVRSLPPDYRDVVYLYFYEGYTHDEIADITKQSKSTVRRHLEKAKELLRDYLEEGEYVS